MQMYGYNGPHYPHYPPIMPVPYPLHPSPFQPMQAPISTHFAPFGVGASPIAINGQGVNVTRTIPDSTAQWVINEAKAALRDVQTLDLARHLVADVVEEHTDPSVARYSEMMAIHDFVSTRVRYTSDPFGIELVYGAKAIIDRIMRVGKFAEDCDGFTVLSLALLLSIGHVCQVLLVGYTNIQGWQHIFVQDFMPSFGWVTFDPSMKQNVRDVLASVDKVKAFPVNAHLD